MTAFPQRLGAMRWLECRSLRLTLAHAESSANAKLLGTSVDAGGILIIAYGMAAVVLSVAPDNV